MYLIHILISYFYHFLREGLVRENFLRVFMMGNTSMHQAIIDRIDHPRKRPEELGCFQENCIIFLNSNIYQNILQLLRLNLVHHMNSIRS